MNPPTDIASSPAEDRPWDDPAASVDSQSSPQNWLDAALALIASRVGLIQLESRAAAKAASRKAIKCVLAAALLFFGWSLLLAGGVALVAHFSSWSWHWVALGCAALHVVVAFLLARSAAAPGPPPFPITRAELQKDREWINNLKNNGKSNA